MTKGVRYLGTLLLGSGACSSSSVTPPALRFEEANVVISFERDGGHLSLSAAPEYAPNACPEPVEIAASFNGTDLAPRGVGGGDRESGQLMCHGLFVSAPFDPDTTDFQLDLELDQGAADVASWHVAAAWDAIATKVWSDDNIYRAGMAGEPFTVRWSPEHARAPHVTASTLSVVDLSSEPIPLEELERAPGHLRYRFAGELPSIFRVFAQDSVRPKPTQCDGFDRCTVAVTSSFSLIEIKLGSP